MPLTFVDDTSGTQRFQAANAGGIELGSGTPGAGFSVMGNQILDGSSLANDIVPPAGVSRKTGSVTLTSQNLTTVVVGAIAGFGTVDGALLVRCDGDRFSAALKTSTAGVVETHNYSVF
jgi:hypothetical protein